MMGYNLGFEADEFQWPFNILRYLVLAVVGLQVFTTIFRRKEKGFYVAMWYTTAGSSPRSAVNSISDTLGIFI